MHLSIIIPAYNEARRIEKTLTATHNYLSRQKFDYEILVVDDGSKDSTAKIVTSLSGTKIPHLRLLAQPDGRNAGKGEAIKLGMAVAQGEYCLFMDADNSTPIESLDTLFPEIHTNDIVIGSRRISGARITLHQPWYRTFLGHIFRTIIRAILPLTIIDTQNGFKLFTRAAAKKLFPEITTKGWAFDVELLALARREKMQIKEMPVTWHNDADSRMTVRGMWRMLVDTIKIKHRYQPSAHIFAPIIILALSLATRLYMFGHPQAVVFDEVYFGKFLTDYAQGTYFFDIHPPLGKLILFAFGSLIGFTGVAADSAASGTFASIGNNLSDAFITLRLIPSLAGALVPLVVYFLARRLKLSIGAAFLAGMLLVLENSLLTQSRFLLIDSQLLLFGFTSLWLYFWSRDCGKEKKSRAQKILFVGAALFAGMAASVKWTGLAYGGLIGLIELAHLTGGLWTDKRSLRRLWTTLWIGTVRIMTLSLIIVATYSLFMSLHISLLTKSGSGDAYMSQAFQAGLEGNSLTAPGGSTENKKFPELNLFDKNVELNRAMYSANARLTATHPYSSKWYSWPILARPIYFWNGLNEPGITAGTSDFASGMIYSMGNPIVYWLSTLAMLLLLATLILATFGKVRIEPHQRKVGWFLLIAYLANWLPFIFIGRVMFLYHYLAALIFAVLTLAFLIDWIGTNTQNTPQDMQSRNKNGAMAFIFGFSIFCAALITFLYFSPLTYGIQNITPEKIEAKFWFKSWR